MRYPTLALGERNGGVRALQYALHRALAAKDLPHVNLRNGTYGSKTQQDVNRFKAAYGITPVQGKDFGGDGEWKALETFLGAHDRRKLRARNAAIAAERAKAKALAAIAKLVGRQTALVATSMKFYTERFHYRYRQVRPMVGGIFDPANYDRLDCSSTVTLLYKEAGCPDPNGRGYDGQGYTGTLWPRGELVTGRAQANDLAFYGWQDGGIPSHVAIHVSADTVVSFGHTPPIKDSVHYRSDYRGSRRYPLK
jgi:cell wall-associated NlpC family hydrolase